MPARFSKIKKCSYKNCLSNEKDDPNLRFFHFPPKLISSWIAASGNNDLKTLSFSQIRFNRFICAKHFDVSCFKEIFSPIKTRQGLKLGSIPRQYVESVECNEADTEVSLPTDEASSSTSDQTRPKIWVSKSLTEIPVKKHDKSGPEISVDTLSKVSSSAPLKAMSEVPAQTRAPLTTPVRNIAPTPIAKTTTSTLGSTLLQMPASTSTSTPVITPTAILVRTPIAPPVKTFMAIPVTALVITPVVATAIAGTNASSNTLEEVSTPTCVAQADQVAPQQNLGSAPTNEKDSQENDLVRKNEASSTWEKKSEQPPVLVTTELQPALYLPGGSVAAVNHPIKEFKDKGTMPSVSTSKRKRGEKENHPKPTDSYLYAKLLGDLDADIENLELQLSRLEAEVLKYGSAIDRSLLKLQSNVSKRPVRPGMIRAALLGCQQHLLDDAFQFLSRQRITSKKHHWDMVSSKFPIMLAKCGLSVWGVLKMLFRLPSKCTVTKYKGRARRNPSVFNNSVFTNIFLRKEKTTRFYRARKRNLGKLKTSKSSVSDSLRDFLGEKSNMDASN